MKRRELVLGLGALAVLRASPASAQSSTSPRRIAFLSPATEKFGRRVNDRHRFDLDDVRLGLVGQLTLHRLHIVGNFRGRFADGAGCYQREHHGQRGRDEDRPFSLWSGEDQIYRHEYVLRAYDDWLLRNAASG